MTTVEKTMRLTSLKKRLGDALVDVGIITPEQLRESLDIQKRNGGKLGAILSQMGALNEEVMLAFLGKQCGVPYVSLNEYGEIPQTVIHSLPESLVRHQNLVPISKDKNTITVAMSDPFNIFAVDDIKLLTGFDVKVVISSEAEIKSAITKYYFHQPELENALLTIASLPELKKIQEKIEVLDENLIHSLLNQAFKVNASEIYIEPQPDAVRIRYRIDGALQEQCRLSKEFMEVIVKRLKAMAHLAEKSVAQEGRFQTHIDNRTIDLKISVAPSVSGERVLLQIVTRATPVIELNKLGFETETISIYRKNIEAPTGLTLIIGPLKSGKTTTLYSTLTAMNYADRDIICIENPVEYIHQGITQAQPASKSGFADLCEFYLRQNPDIIALGEISDSATAKLAIDAALAGRAVFAVLPAFSAQEAVAYLNSLGIDPLLATSVITMIINQRIVRMVCPECKEPYEIKTVNLRGLGIEHHASSDNSGKITLWRGKGCLNCNNTGYHGRTGIFEITRFNKKLSILSSDQSKETSIKKASRQKGIITLEEAAWRKVRGGLSTTEEMLRNIKL
jgi:type IV pilus assembly protein PilB